MTQKTVIDSEDLSRILGTPRVMVALESTTVPKCYLERIRQVVLSQNVSEGDSLKLAVRFSMDIESNLQSRGNCQGSGCPKQGILVPSPGNTFNADELLALNASTAIKDGLSIADIAGCYLQALRDALVISADANNCSPSSVDALGLLFSLEVSTDIEAGGNCQGSGCPKKPKVATAPTG